MWVSIRDSSQSSSRMFLQKVRPNHAPEGTVGDMSSIRQWIIAKLTTLLAPSSHTTPY